MSNSSLSIFSNAPHPPLSDLFMDSDDEFNHSFAALVEAAEAATPSPIPRLARPTYIDSSLDGELDWDHEEVPDSSPPLSPSAISGTVFASPPPSPHNTEPRSPSPAAEPPAAGAAQAALRGSYCKHWCFTLNHPSDDEFAHLACLPGPDASGTVAYIVLGREVGETGTPHLQAYLELKERKRMAWLKDNVSNRAHFEPRRGTRDQARDYCCKDGDWLEGGLWHEEERGRRRDIETMVEQASQGVTFFDACIEEPTSALFPYAYSKLLEGAALAAVPPWRDVTVVVKIGPTGTGKTRSAYDCWPDLFVQDCSAGGEMWWDDYSGQKRLVLDDFDGKIKYRYLLRLLDGYPVRLKVKGAFTYGVWSEVVITTNVPILSWFPKEDDIAPLCRRITSVERYTAPGVFTVHHFPPAFL